MKEYKIKGEVLFDGKVVRVERDEIELENGEKSFREVVYNNGGVAVLALTKEEELILVKQFRYPSKEDLYEIPGGRREEKEELVLAGLRELKEETGYTTKEAEYFGYFYPTVAYCSETIHLVIAKNCIYEKQCLDEGEYVEIVKVPFKKAVEMVYKNEIKDGKTVIAILKYANLKK